MLVLLLLTSVPSIAPPIAQTPAPIVRTPSIRTVPYGLRPPSEMIRRGIPRLTPQEAVMKAAEVNPAPVHAIFDLKVRRAEQVGPRFFLNSEQDYRDPRNVSIVLSPVVMAELQRQHGDDLPKIFVGHRLLVMGGARTVRIVLTDADGRRTDKYYFQTHVPVTSVRQLERVDD